MPKMDVAPNDNPLQGAEFSPNAFGSLDNQVFIKQEITDEEVLDHIGVSEYDELKTVKDEVKLEESEYASPDDIAFGGSYNQVFIKQEISNEETATQKRVSEYDPLEIIKKEVKLELDWKNDLSSVSEYHEFKSVKDEVKLEESEDAGRDDLVQNLFSDLKNDQSSKRAKAAERKKRYRAKKKQLGTSSEEKAKAALRSKNYRQRQKLLRLSSCDSDKSQRASIKKNGKMSKTNAEFCREYRQRQKMSRQLSQTQSSTYQSRRVVQIVIVPQVQPLHDQNMI